MALVLQPPRKTDVVYQYAMYYIDVLRPEEGIVSAKSTTIVPFLLQCGAFTQAIRVTRWKDCAISRNTCCLVCTIFNGGDS